jgi:hypothetical protein
VVLVRTDVSEERIASIIRVKGISELRRTSAVTSTETSVLTRATRRQIPEDGILYNGFASVLGALLRCYMV